MSGAANKMKGAVYRPHHASDPNYGKPPCLSNNNRSNASHSPLLRRSKRPPEAPPSRRLEQELAWYSFRFGFDAAPFAVNIFVVLINVGWTAISESALRARLSVLLIVNYFECSFE